MPPRSTVRDGVEARRGPRGVRHRARIKVAGQVVVGPYRESRADAVRDRDRLRHERRREEVTAKAAGWTLERGMREVLDDLVLRGARPDSIRDRKAKFRNLAKRLGKTANLAEIDRDRVRAYVAGRMSEPVSVNTARKDISALSTVFQIAIDRGALAVNPCRGARLPKVHKREVDWFTADELAGILASIRSWSETRAWHAQRDADIIELLALTGMRSTESSKVEIRDVQVGRRHIVVREGKTGLRTIRLNDRALNLAQRVIGDREKGRLWPFGNHGLRSLFERWSNRLNEPRLHPHAIRHTYGTALAAAGMSAHALARAMGHSTLQMSMVYVHHAGGDSDAIDGLAFSQPTT